MSNGTDYGRDNSRPLSVVAELNIERHSRQVALIVARVQQRQRVVADVVRCPNQVLYRYVLLEHPPLARLHSLGQPELLQRSHG